MNPVKVNPAADAASADTTEKAVPTGSTPGSTRAPGHL
jgi:hypothetical protein